LAAKIITHTVHAKEGVPSRQERRKAMFKPRASEPQISVATISSPVLP
jgi:hypothetical protein